MTLWPAELQLQYTNFKNNLQQIAQKIGDIEQETEEHKYVCYHRMSVFTDDYLSISPSFPTFLLPPVFTLQPSSHRSLAPFREHHHSKVTMSLTAPSRLVLETLEPLAGDRKCFRMINGVLVERTVKDVVPALKTNSEGLKTVLEDLLRQYKNKQDEMEKWKVRWEEIFPRETHGWRIMASTLTMIVVHPLLL